jgi:hypothetical protein
MKSAPAYPLDGIGDINLTSNLWINGIATLSNTTFNIPTISNVRIYQIQYQMYVNEIIS